MDNLFADATIIIDLEASSKRRALQGLADAVSSEQGLDVSVVMQHLLEREQLGATGVGGGVAMPHGRIKGLERIAVGFARLSNPVEYESPDGEPVDLVMLLLAPEEAGAVCLKALSRASRVLRSEQIRTGLRKAASSDEIRALLSTSQTKLAA